MGLNDGYAYKNLDAALAVKNVWFVNLQVPVYTFLVVRGSNTAHISELGRNRTGVYCGL